MLLWEFHIVDRTEVEFYKLTEIQLSFQSKKMYQFSFCM